MPCGSASTFDAAATRGSAAECGNRNRTAGRPGEPARLIRCQSMICGPEFVSSHVLAYAARHAVRHPMRIIQAQHGAASISKSALIVALWAAFTDQWANS